MAVRTPWSVRALENSNGNIGVPKQERAIYKRRWSEVRLGSRNFLSRVHLVLRVLVPETACVFGRFQFDMPPESGFLHGKRKKGSIELGQSMLHYFNPYLITVI